MTKRPTSITLVGWTFIVFCGVLAAVALLPLDRPGGRGAAVPGANETLDLVLATVSRLLGVLGGALVLYGQKWGRWLLVAWMAGHIVLSALHSPFQLLVHGALFALIVYGLYRPDAEAYFRSRAASGAESREPAPIPGSGKGSSGKSDR